MVSFLKIVYNWPFLLVLQLTTGGGRYTLKYTVICKVCTFDGNMQNIMELILQEIL